MKKKDKSNLVGEKSNMAAGKSNLRCWYIQLGMLLNPIWGADTSNFGCW